MSFNFNGVPSVPSSSPPRNKAPWRILCLHDANSNANELRGKLKKLADRLWKNHTIELVYVDAPIIMTQPQSSHAENRRRSWWQATTTNAGEEEEDAAAAHDKDRQPCGYLGLDASLLLLQQMWSSYASFTGILGVGQGAAIGALLTLCLFQAQYDHHYYPSEVYQGGTSPGQRAPPQMAIWIDGYTVLPEDAPLLSIQLLECFHILQAKEDAKKDSIHNAISSGNSSRSSSSSVNDDVNISHSLALPSQARNDTTTTTATAKSRFLTQMGGQTHICGISQDWFCTENLNRMGRYLIQQQKKQYPSQSTMTTMVRLQQALVATEQRAAQLVAQHALQHPPPSLMAIIGPSQLSGWQGPKRNLPAGGAPCPADFVKPVHMRPIQPDNHTILTPHRRNDDENHERK